MATTITNAQVEVSNPLSPEEQIAALASVTTNTSVGQESEFKKLEKSLAPSDLNLWEEMAKDGCRTKQFMTNFSTIFVLGNQHAGKTTLINAFLEKSDPVKPTLALDYSFARLRSSDTKRVCNIWELGGDAKRFSDLIETPIITSDCLDKLAIFVVLDLSEPQKLWPAFDAVITQGKRAFKSAISSMDKMTAVELTQKLDERLTVRIADAEQDKDSLEPFPLPLVIIGAKYDQFEKFEPEMRKTICRVLRLVSHRLGASLNFFSRDDISLTRRMREIFSHYAFDTPFPKGISQDMNKPVMIPHGADSYEQISPGVPHQQLTIEYCRHLYESRIGKNVEKDNAKYDPALDPNFREPDIDRKRADAVQELSFRHRADMSLVTDGKSNTIETFVTN